MQICWPGNLAPADRPFRKLRQSPHHLSGVSQQRFSLPEPWQPIRTIWLLHEPALGNLDPKLKEQFHEKMRHIY